VGSGQRLGARGFRRVAVAAWVLVATNILSGATVRLTGSGLGCPDWPRCTAHRFTPPAALHPLVEFSNRVVVLLLVVAAVATTAASLARRPLRRDLVALSAGLVVGIVADALVGAVVVYSHLDPYVVMVHFLVGMAILTDASVLVLRARHDGGAGIARADRATRRVAWLLAGVLAAAIAAGTATTGAGPHAGGPGAQRVPIAFAEMAKIHALLVWSAAAVLVGLLLLLETRAGHPQVLARARALLVVVACQGALGYTQYFLRVPAALVGLHVAGAIAVWTAAVVLLSSLYDHPRVGVATVEEGIRLMMEVRR
jgi:cytochrome c oxidase assembly protein subunit 15